MSYSDEVLADSPLAYYRLGESSGTTMVDSSGNGRHGTYAGSPTLGAPGLLVDDPDTAIDVAGGSRGVVTAASWMQVTQFSASAWVKPDTVTGPHAVINRANYDAANNAPTRSWLIHQAGNRFLCSVYCYTTGVFYVASPAVGPTLTVGGVYHVALTFNGTVVKFYINAAEVYSAPLEGPLREAVGVDLTIGAEHENNISDRFDGVIDEVAFFDHALSAGRVSAHYAAGTTSGSGAIRGTLAASLPGPLS